MSNGTDGAPTISRLAQLKTFLVCGVTGVGKSTFVNAATGAKLSVSRKIDSDTSEVIEEGIPLIKLGGEHIQLVDTPGFGDSRMSSETDVLKQVTTWLAARHMSGYLVTGVIFIRPMETVRVDQQERSLMLMFKDMLGDEYLDHIFLLTTRWPSAPNEEYEKREQEIVSRDDIFGSNKKTKIQIRRLKESYSSEDAREVVKSCTGLSPVMFRIQREVVGEKKTLGQTEAGIRIGADLDERLSGLEEQATTASQYAEAEIKRLREAEKAKHQLEKESARATEEANQAAEAQKEAQRQAEATKARMEEERVRAEDDARKAEEEKRIAQKAEEEARDQQERERAEEEKRIKEAEADAKATQQRADEAAAEAARLREAEESAAAGREQEPDDPVGKFFNDVNNALNDLF